MKKWTIEDSKELYNNKWLGRFLTSELTKKEMFM